MATEKDLNAKQVSKIICSVVSGNPELEELFIKAFKKDGDVKCQSKK